MILATAMTAVVPRVKVTATVTGSLAKPATGANCRSTLMMSKRLVIQLAGDIIDQVASSVRCIKPKGRHFSLLHCWQSLSIRFGKPQSW